MSSLVLMVRCESCQKQVDDDRIGGYRDRVICDDCAEKLHPERYNDTEFEIIAEGEKMCLAKTGSTMAAYGVAVIEDDMGDVVSFTERCAELFIAPAVIGQSLSNLLPEEARLTHRKIHRQAITMAVPKQHSFMVNGEHWTAEFHPFTAENEKFTLSLFSR
jgi:hypothetical protein